MTERQLVAHALCPANSVEAFAVECERDGKSLWLRYILDMPLASLELPGPANSDRAENLWKTTCFELFARLPDEAGYVEFNFSPSSEWAAYVFAGYRDLLDDAAMAGSPTIFLDAGEEWLKVEVSLLLPEPWATAPLDISLSAVIEETDGTKSYWALRHPPGKPDFHHPDCFALRLPAPDAA
ncbi:MAG: DOMON-like domain-containing protein [Sphingopyxis sp.]|nr:DOMON-like domain-containing protein [Sphingopyxis sp.]